MSEPNPQAPVVLTIDDAEDIRNLIVAVLGKDYRVKAAEDGRSGLQSAAAAPKPDLILLDVEMPGANGFEVCKALKSNPATASIPVLFLTSRDEPDYESKGFAVGAVDYINKPINTVLLRARVRTHLGLANREHELAAMVRERTAELGRARQQVIRRVGRAMEYHESTSAGNRVVRTTQYARLIALASGARADVVELCANAAPLYDIGKIGVPPEILRKKGPLSAPDWEQIRRHPEIGAAIIGDMNEPVMQIANAMALSHHERWDGRGYPKGIKGEQIPWPGRLMAIVDAFEAMTTQQFYRRPLTPEQAAVEIAKGAGTRYDPTLVEAFSKALPSMRKVREAVTDSLTVKVDFEMFDRLLGQAAPAKPAAAAAQAARPGAAPAAAGAARPAQPQAKPAQPQPRPAPAATKPKKP